MIDVHDPNRTPRGDRRGATNDEVSMNGIGRRTFLKGVLGASATLALPRVARAQTATPHVVVIGAGFAGATVAKYLRLWSRGGVRVTLIEPNPTHVSCILSNLVVIGKKSLDDITIPYDALRSNHGVDVVQDRVTGIGASAVTTASGAVLDFDRLVVAPGIDFFPVDGLETPEAQALVPHAWIAGPQTLDLKEQLRAMPRRGTFVMTIPAKPYRCPPGPYERACVIADFVKRRKRGKVVVLDANPAIVAEPETFHRAFTERYAGVVEYVPGAELQRVSFETTATGGLRRVAWVNIAGGPEVSFAGDVLNVIPKQKAGRILFDGGLVNVDGRWAGVDPRSYASTVPGASAIHVIGDSQATGQPKAGHIANAEAKVCADAILRSFAGEAPDPEPVTNSACYSPITATKASWLTSAFAFDPATGTMKSVAASAGEAPEVTRENFRQMLDWARNLFADTFF